MRQHQDVRLRSITSKRKRLQLDKIKYHTTQQNPNLLLTKRQSNPNKILKAKYLYENFRKGLVASRSKNQAVAQRQAYSTGRNRPTIRESKDHEHGYKIGYGPKLGRNTNRLDNTTLPEAKE